MPSTGTLVGLRHRRRRAGRQRRRSRARWSQRSTTRCWPRSIAHGPRPAAGRRPVAVAGAARGGHGRGRHRCETAGGDPPRGRLPGRCGDDRLPRRASRGAWPTAVRRATTESRICSPRCSPPRPRSGVPTPCGASPRPGGATCARSGPATGVRGAPVRRWPCRTHARVPRRATSAARCSSVTCAADRPARGRPGGRRGRRPGPRTAAGAPRCMATRPGGQVVAGRARRRFPDRGRVAPGPRARPAVGGTAGSHHRGCRCRPSWTTTRPRPRAARCRRCPARWCRSTSPPVTRCPTATCWWWSRP